MLWIAKSGDQLGNLADPLMIYNQANQENEEITFLLMPLRS